MMWKTMRCRGRYALMMWRTLWCRGKYALMMWRTMSRDRYTLMMSQVDIASKCWEVGITVPADRSLPRSKVLFLMEKRLVIMLQW